MCHEVARCGHRDDYGSVCDCRVVYRRMACVCAGVWSGDLSAAESRQRFLDAIERGRALGAELLRPQGHVELLEHPAGLLGLLH